MKLNEFKEMLANYKPIGIILYKGVYIDNTFTKEELLKFICFLADNFCFKKEKKNEFE